MNTKKTILLSVVGAVVALVGYNWYKKNKETKAIDAAKDSAVGSTAPPLATPGILPGDTPAATPIIKQPIQSDTPDAVAFTGSPALGQEAVFSNSTLQEMQTM